MLRSKIGVESRGGVASWTLRGKTLEGNRLVEVTIPHQGPVDVYHRKPVEKDEKGKSFQIIAPPKQADKLLKEMQKSLEKKGVSLSEPTVSQSPNQTIHSLLEFNLTTLNAGLMKIAYLACCELLGDSFLDDPLNPEWQKAIRAMTMTEMDDVKIKCWGFSTATEFAKEILPSLEEHEHVIAILNLGRQGVIVAVRLFACELLTSIVQASETSNHGLPARRGQMLICNSITGDISRKPIIVEGAEA